MDYYCLRCNSKFDAFPSNQKYCWPCADIRQKERSSLQSKAKTRVKRIERKLAKDFVTKKLYSVEPAQSVKGWQELILEDLANPFDALTEQELCRKYKVPTEEFYAFKLSLGDFTGELNKRSEKYANQESIYYRKMLIKHASRNPNAVLVGLQITKQYVKGMNADDPLMGLSEADKKKELEQLLAKAKAGGKEWI